MTVDDLSGLIPLQEAGAVKALAHVFAQDTHPFPRQAIEDRWRQELQGPDVDAYVATVVSTAQVVAFAARRRDELLHFGTAPATWGSGLATWVHDRLIATYPPEFRWLRLWVFAENKRARSFYEKLGWRPTGEQSRSSFEPRPILLEYAMARRSDG
jgi:GNAT superfamily N-acetyltransferase